jgi:hypothetical protein
MTKADAEPMASPAVAASQLEPSAMRLGGRFDIYATGARVSRSNRQA